MYHRPGLINHNYTPSVLRSSCPGVTVLLRMRNTLITASHLSTPALEHTAAARPDGTRAPGSPSWTWYPKPYPLTRHSLLALLCITKSRRVADNFRRLGREPAFIVRSRRGASASSRAGRASRSGMLLSRWLLLDRLGDLCTGARRAIRALLRCV